MVGDWIFDHFGWLLAGVVVIIIGVTTWLVIASGGMSGPACPPGQRLVQISSVPITSNVGNTPITTVVPIYGCE